MGKFPQRYHGFMCGMKTFFLQPVSPDILPSHFEERSSHLLPVEEQRTVLGSGSALACYFCRPRGKSAGAVIRVRLPQSPRRGRRGQHARARVLPFGFLSPSWEIGWSGYESPVATESSARAPRTTREGACAPLRFPDSGKFLPILRCEAAGIGGDEVILGNLF